MYQIQQLQAVSNQTQTLVLPDGTLLSMTLYYSDQQYGWFMSLQYGSTFTLNGMRICVNPNMLLQWNKLLDFGMACLPTTANREPTQLADFASGLFNLFILDSTEVAAYNTFLTTGSISIT